MEPEAHFNLDEGGSVEHKGQPVSAQKTKAENEHGSFDCNICLESARDPVVTLCGHLYCWPCIYKWLNISTAKIELHQQNCPVCKANISADSLVPLYGRGGGKSPSLSEAKRTYLYMGIPSRPTSRDLDASFISTTSSTSHPGQQLYPNYFHPTQQVYHEQSRPQPHRGNAASILSNLGAATMTAFTNPAIGMAELYDRFFGSSGTSLFCYPNSLPLLGNASPRMRRHEIKIDKSLNRVFIFFLCCIMLCLILF